MAAGAWKICSRAKKKISNGTIVLGGGSATPMRIALVKTLGATPADVSLLGSFTEVTDGNGYADKALSAEAWTGADAANDVTMKFDASNVVWTATGGVISGIKGAVIFRSGTTSLHVLCYCTLTGTAFDLAQGNTLTIQMASTGIFELY